MPAGTYTCGVILNEVSVTFNYDDDTTDWQANGVAVFGTCEVVLSADVQNGDPVRGTFSADLLGRNDDPDLRIENGVFDFPDPL